MLNKDELVSQTRLAFDFIQKLYFEVSYLIKEAEGLLAQEDEEFIFGRSGGYAITARSSNGLEPSLVNLWMYKKMAVFFVPKASTETPTGKTTTRIKKDLKILYMRIILDDKDIPEPTVYYGVLHTFVRKENSWLEKIEQLMTQIEYNESKVFDGNEKIDYEDRLISFKGKLESTNLFDIQSSQDIADKILAPALNIFREA
jgi:hypothetical protein